MQICIAQNYPKNLVSALSLIHQIDTSTSDIQIVSDKPLTVSDSSSTVVFLFDKGKRNLDITTENYFKMGFRVFAFKMSSAETLNPFELSLTVLGLWRRMLNEIRGSKFPFVITYTYKGKALNKAKGFD